MSHDASIENKYKISLILMIKNLNSLRQRNIKEILLTIWRIK